MPRTHMILALTLSLGAELANGQMIGINVLLNTPVDAAALANLSSHGQVLEVIPEIRAVRLRAAASELAGIQALPFVIGANSDAKRSFLSGPTVPDFSGGANQWSLDAINVMDAGAGRTVAYDGQGVYVAVLDTGLVHNWREYFPQERIATQFARCFGGGGADRGTISDQPDKWEHDTYGHGTAVTSIILGFQYCGPEALPVNFNGVAPRATVIPVKFNTAITNDFWSSTGTRALVYLANLKASGALGQAPLVVNMSFGRYSAPDWIEQAALDYAIANGVVLVAAAGNGDTAGMGYPAAYAPVISVANAGWVGQFPADDQTTITWIQRDVPENDASQFYIAWDSSRQLDGQQLDVTAPGTFVPTPWGFDQRGQADYSFMLGTSAACPHVAGIAALMLQKNPALTQAQVETILESTALPLPPGCRDVTLPYAVHDNHPTWGDHSNVFLSDTPTSICWESNATGHGLVQADAALAATPMP